MSSWFIPCAGASSPKGNTLAPTPATARRIRSLHLTRVQAPDESAVAIYEHVWFSSAKVRGSFTVAAMPEAVRPKPDWWQVSGCPGGRHRRT